MGKFDKKIPETVPSRYAGLVDAVQSGWFNQESNELFRGFAISSSDVVLDFGCGEGAAGLFSAQRGAHIVLADIEPTVIARVEERIRQEANPRKIESLISDATPLHLPDDYASKIVCMEVLEHIEEPLDILSELVRVGEPGAQYLLTVPGAKGEQMQQRVAPESYFREPNHLHIFEREDFVGLVEESGLAVEDYSQSGFFWVMWMNLFWASEAAEGNTLDGPIRDRIVPPFDKNLDRWASLWLKLISTPQGRAFKTEMDALLPKNQVILARKIN